MEILFFLLQLFCLVILYLIIGIIYVIIKFPDARQEVLNWPMRLILYFSVMIATARIKYAIRRQSASSGKKD